MPIQLQQIIAFCSRRCRESRGSQPRLATANLLIAQLAGSLRLGHADAGPLLLDFINQKHTDPDLAKACQEVLAHIAAAP